MEFRTRTCWKRRGNNENSMKIKRWKGKVKPFLYTFLDFDKCQHLKLKVLKNDKKWQFPMTGTWPTNYGGDTINRSLNCFSNSKTSFSPYRKDWSKMTFLGGNLFAYIFKSHLKYSQTRVDLMIERINIAFTSSWLVERLDLMKMLKAWFRFDRQKGVEESIVPHEVKQQTLPRDKCLKFKIEQIPFSVSSSCSFKS